MSDNPKRTYNRTALGSLQETMLVEVGVFSAERSSRPEGFEYRYNWTAKFHAGMAEDHGCEHCWARDRRVLEGTRTARSTTNPNKLHLLHVLFVLRSLKAADTRCEHIERHFDGDPDATLNELEADSRRAAKSEAAAEIYKAVGLEDARRKKAKRQAMKRRERRLEAVRALEALGLVECRVLQGGGTILTPDGDYRDYSKLGPSWRITASGVQKVEEFANVDALIRRAETIRWGTRSTETEEGVGPLAPEFGIEWVRVTRDHRDHDTGMRIENIGLHRQLLVR